MLIKIEIEGKSFAVAELDQRNPNIANRLYQMLPIGAAANLWGE